MSFPDHVIEAMQEHAEACYPAESCGLVLWGDYVPRENVHSDPERHFRIAEKDLAPLLKHNRIQALVHSHPAPAAPDYPSYGDMRQQVAMDCPWGIVPVGEDGRAGKPFFWGDGLAPPPLLERPYRWGVTDCYSLVRDWYRLHLRIWLPQVARRWNYWTQADAADLYLLKYKEAGFTRLDPVEADLGDTLLYRLGKAGATHHAAVVIEPGKILHHPAKRPVDPGSLSRRDLVTRYQQYITHVLRPTKAVARI